MGEDATHLRAAWDAQAADWIAWARAWPGCSARAGACASRSCHPFNSPKALPSYFEQRAYPETRERGGLRMTFHDTHRPLEAYAGALQDAGLLIEAIREPRPDDAYVTDHPEVARWRERPCFLLARAVKPPAEPPTPPAAG